MLYAQQTFAHMQDIYTWDILPTGIRVPGHLTLDDLKLALLNDDSPFSLASTGFPVTFSKDQIQSGNLVSKQVEDCLVLKNSMHPNDYFHFVFTVRTTGNMTTISIYRSGQSPLSGQQNKRENRKNSDSLFQNILGAVTKTDEQALAKEYDYYDMVATAIKSILGI